MPPNRRNVQPTGDGRWKVSNPEGERASGIFGTQEQARRRAHDIVENTGGGEVTVFGRDGRIRDSDTVPPGNDPNPPRDKK